MPYDAVPYHAMPLSSRYFVIDLPRAFSPFTFTAQGGWVSRIPTALQRYPPLASRYCYDWY
jgi:hypothetical protein